MIKSSEMPSRCGWLLYFDCYCPKRSAGAGICYITHRIAAADENSDSVPCADWPSSSFAVHRLPTRRGTSPILRPKRRDLDLLAHLSLLLHRRRTSISGFDLLFSPWLDNPVTKCTATSGKTCRVSIRIHFSESV